MHKKRMIFLSSLSLLPLISCNANYINSVTNNQYTVLINQPNNLVIQNNQYINSSIDKLSNAFLIDYQYTDEVEYDYINKRIKKPSKRKMIFNLASSITLYHDNNTKQIYDNDLAEVKPESDLGTGYSTPYINLTSANNNSINNTEFINNVNKAVKIEFNLKNINYVNHKNESTNNNLLGQDFWYSIKKNELNKSLNLTEIEKYGIDTVKFMNSDNYKNNKIIFDKKNQWDFFNYLKNELMKNTIYSPISSAFINTNNKQNNYGLNWYQSNLDNSLFLSDYILNSNTLSQKIYSINKFKNIDIKNKINKIIFKYQLLPLNSSEFEEQNFQGYNSGLISEVPLEQLNENQKQIILKNIKQNKINFSFNEQNQGNIINSFYNLKNISNSEYNKNFAKLIYGKEKGINYEYFFNGESWKFRNNLSNIINHYAINFLSDKKETWLSYANPKLLIQGKDDKFNNYNNLYDAKYFVNEQIIINESENKRFNQLDEENKFFQNETSNDLLKNVYFKKNIEEIKKIVDRYYEKGNSGKMSWSIPIYKNIITNKENVILSQMISLIKSIDSRLNPQYKFVYNLSDLNEIKNSKKYYTIFKNQNYDFNNLKNYLLEWIKDKDNSLLILLILKNKNLFTHLNKFKDYFWNSLISKNIIKNKLTENEINLNTEPLKWISKNNSNLNNEIKNIIDNYFLENNNFELIKLINEIELSYAKPLSLDTGIKYDNLSENLIQKRFIKPYFEKNIINYIDIKIK